MCVYVHVLIYVHVYVCAYACAYVCVPVILSVGVDGEIGCVVGGICIVHPTQRQTQNTDIYTNDTYINAYIFPTHLSCPLTQTRRLFYPPPLPAPINVHIHIHIHIHTHTFIHMNMRIHTCI